MANPHAGVPFESSDDEIAASLEDVSIPTLLLSLVHITGDLELIRGQLAPAGLFLNEVQGYMSEEDKAAARALALPIIAAYRDAGCPEPAPLDQAAVAEMMRWLVCEEVPDEYVEMLMEEMELDGTDARSCPPPGTKQARAALPVVVIGCGESGLLAGIRLAEADIPFTIFEKNQGVGGTWWENTYPGARVDVGNHFYCYSFEPSDEWTEYFARQPELQRYFEATMRKHGIDEHIVFETEVTRCVWDEDDDVWSVETLDALGHHAVHKARAVISAVGQLNRPSVPAFEGAEDFAGPSFHSARWDHSVELAGKRVAMIGAGASGFQIAPASADFMAKLLHGPDQQRAVSEMNELTRIMFTDWITSQLDGDDELIAKVVPDYPPTGKRTLQDNGSWLATLRRDNVELVRTGIDHLEPSGVVDADGQLHEADVVVYATGFKATKVLWPMDIVGREGQVLAERWGDRPAAYLGMTVPGFPNLFLMYGPGTNLAHGGSLIFHSECQMRYILGCLRTLIEDDLVAMEPTEEACRSWHERSQAELSRLVWTQPSIEHSFFKNDDGEVHILSPWRLVDYWSWTKEPDLGDFVMIHST